MDLVLRPARLADEQACRQAHEELAAEDFAFLLEDPSLPWSAYLARLDEVAHGRDLAPDRVPATFLLADVGGEVVGRTSIRHELNDWLARYGGHIGYAVRPAYRRRGYATEILRRSLVVARELGIDRALVCCDDDNVESAAVIERCGGMVAGIAEGRHSGVRRYWAPTA